MEPLNWIKRSWKYVFGFYNSDVLFAISCGLKGWGGQAQMPSLFCFFVRGYRHFRVCVVVFTVVPFVPSLLRLSHTDALILPKP